MKHYNLQSVLIASFDVGKGPRVIKVGAQGTRPESSANWY